MMLPPPQPATLIPVFAIFEGGGAKGITHAGALKAMENVGLLPVGVAGASAGSIVAALVAFGFLADDIFGPDGHLLTSRRKTPLDFLGTADWRLLDYLRRVVGANRIALTGLLLLSPLLIVILYLGPLAYFVVSGSKAPSRLLRRFGFFSGEAFADLVNEILRERLEHVYASLERPLPDRITFADLAPDEALVEAGFAPVDLKIAVTDLATQSLVIISRATHPHAVVGDVVAASSAIPLVFRPARIRGIGHDGERRYADGGLVSNLPVWAFREEKRALERRAFEDTPIRTMALTLVDPPETVLWRPTNVLGLIARVARTGVFGSQKIVEDFVPDLHVIGIESPIGVLAFDCSAKDARRAYDAGLACEPGLRLALRERPAEASSRLDDVLDQLRARIHPQPARRLRACLVRPLRGSTGFRVVATAGYLNEADDRLTLDAAAPGAPFAFAVRDTLFTDLGVLTDDERFMTKYEQALVWPALRSIIAVPIFTTDEWRLPQGQRPPPSGVLCVDSDSDLRDLYDADGVLDALAAAVPAFVPMMESFDDRP